MPAIAFTANDGSAPAAGAGDTGPLIRRCVARRRAPKPWLTGGNGYTGNLFPSERIPAPGEGDVTEGRERHREEY